MCYEWYEESLLDAKIWRSVEQAEERMKRLKSSAAATPSDKSADALKEPVTEQREALAA
ncbi:MAG TPA: hypothetical protein VLA73_06205 [Burkholderiales bacterium]|jgi:hypothetical protein|nr:hypothetical protein [Burkholderiales bacterium]